ncbi:MAG: hypothetical protein ACRDY0_06620 [Acidimicrobiales bacterium]
MIWPASRLPRRHTQSRQVGPGVEANARLTAATGLILIGLLFAEGLTIVSIRPLIGWHIAIGVALIPPIAVKMGSTLWRFGRYYLHDSRYRQAGPPRPLLRALGPVVTLSTVAVFATGVAATIAGPAAATLVAAHKATFVIWFAAMAVHVVAHVRRASQLTWADLAPHSYRSWVPSPRRRQLLLAAALAAGLVLALATTGLANAWGPWSGGRHSG